MNETQKSLKIDDVLTALEFLLGAVNPFIAGHQNRVAGLARAIAADMNLSEDVVESVKIAALLHDIGEIKVPGQILSLPGRLLEEEFNLIKIHPMVGFEILKRMNFSQPIAEIVRQHHERMDGSGYPLGIKGKDILMQAKIIGVADVVEAISSHRPYRPALGLDAALSEISSNKGKLFDPAVADSCINVFKERNFIFQ